jgi:hypothetical protein
MFEHEPQPVQAAGYEQDVEHVRDWHGRAQPADVLAPGLHSPSPVHVPNAGHWQLLVQVRDWVPQLPHACCWVAPAVHWPAPGVNTQPVAGLQESAVQLLPSLQTSAGPPWQSPPEHVSPVVQAFPSEQAAVLFP